MEKWVKSEMLYKGKVVSLRLGEVALDNGSRVKREVVEHGEGVAIVPVLGKSILFVEQFRIAIGKYIVEIPAGRVEPGENPEQCALRELEEEIGYTAESMVEKAAYYSSVGYTNEKVRIFIARALKKTESMPEADEKITIKKIPIKRVEEMLNKARFEDSKTIIGLREFFGR